MIETDTLPRSIECNLRFGAVLSSSEIPDIFVTFWTTVDLGDLPEVLHFPFNAISPQLFDGLEGENDKLAHDGCSSWAPSKEIFSQGAVHHSMKTGPFPLSQRVAPIRGSIGETISSD